MNRHNKRRIMKQKEAIIWDWNGTLLDDLDICILGINRYLKERELNELDRERYRQVFDFPIQKYYSAIGFDFQKESFEDLSVQFMDTYFKNFSQTRLFGHAIDVLDHFKARGYRQFILSAMDVDSLKRSIDHFGIGGYFEYIIGAENILATGKIGYARILMRKEHLDPSTTILVGDTLHDQDVANQLNISCILVSAGHQSHDRLNVRNNHVVHNLEEARQAIEDLH
jgi:phosphoglycolate phosphatase